MKMQIVIRNVDQQRELRNFAEDRLAKALDRFEDAIIDATMRLEDVTGPDKGGIDKLCSVTVRLRTGDVLIKESGDDFRATINTALDRLKAALGRKRGRAKRGIGEG